MFSCLSFVPTRKLHSTESISGGSKYVVKSSLVSVTKSKGEFYLFVKIRLSKQNVVFSDIWLLLLLLRKFSNSCITVSGLENLCNLQ